MDKEEIRKPCSYSSVIEVNAMLTSERVQLWSLKVWWSPFLAQTYSSSTIPFARSYHLHHSAIRFLTLPSEICACELSKVAPQTLICFGLSQICCRHLHIGSTRDARAVWAKCTVALSGLGSPSDTISQLIRRRWRSSRQCTRSSSCFIHTDFSSGEVLIALGAEAESGPDSNELPNNMTWQTTSHLSRRKKTSVIRIQVNHQQDIWVHD